MTSAPTAGSGVGSGRSPTSTSPTSPAIIRPGTSESTKRNASLAGFDSSPGSIASHDLDGGDENQSQDDKKRQPVKRACNECRQQKVSSSEDSCGAMLKHSHQLRCDVVQDPFTTCSRCRRLNLTCKIENNFKRIGKRSRNAEMEREIVDLGRENADLRRKLQQMQRHGQLGSTQRNINTYGQAASQAQLDQWNGSQEAVASLLDLRSGFDGSNGYSRSPKAQAVQSKRIEDVTITPDKVNDIFNS